MSEDLSDMMSKISNMLKSDSDPNRSQSNTENGVNGSSSDSNSSNFNIDSDTISKLVSALSSNSSESSDNSSSTPNIDINTILKMKNIMDKMNQSQNDPRANLLLSLKPYLKKSRKDKVEQYIKLFQMTNVMDFLKATDNGGDSKK